MSTVQTTPDTTALVAYAGKFEKKLFSTLVNGLDAQTDLTVISNIKNSLNLTKLTVTRGARPFTSKFQGGGKAVYSGRKLSVSEGKYELLIVPMDYRSTWMSEVMSGGINPKEIPFAKYLWEQVMKQFASEINDYTTFYGFDKADAVAFDAGATYNTGDYIQFEEDYYLCESNTSAGQSPTTHPAKWKMVNAEAIAVGLKKLLEDEITGANIVEEAIGVIDNAAVHALTAQRALFRSAPAAYKKQGIIIHQSYADFELLIDDIESQLGKYTVKDEMFNKDGSIVIPGTNGQCRAKPVSWMGDSRRLIATPASVSNGRVKSANLLFGTDLLTDINKIATNPSLWEIEAGIAFACGFQIRDLDAIWVNDQA